MPSEASGILLVRERRNSAEPVSVECIRRATPAKDAYRLTPEQVIDVARLANLRMWEAYMQRDAERAMVEQLRAELGAKAG